MANRRQPDGVTRRDVLQRLWGAAAAAPFAGLPAPPEFSGDDLSTFLGLEPGTPAAPAQQTVAPSAPAPAPAPWQPPYPYEPLVPENPVVLPMLMYHRATGSSVFEAQLVGMLTAGYRPLSLHNALRGLLGETALPEMPIVLTFDDGWAVQYEAVFPVLKQYKIPATFFVMPGFHEKQEGYMDWDQIADIADFGLEVESHTLNHADLPRLARRDWGAVLAEVVLSKQVLEERLQQPVRYFDYPLGRVNEEIQQLVRDAGYDAAVIIGPGVHQSADTPFALRRIRVEAWDPWWRVEHKLDWYGAGPSHFAAQAQENAQPTPTPSGEQAAEGD